MEALVPGPQNRPGAHRNGNCRIDAVAFKSDAFAITPGIFVHGRGAHRGVVAHPIPDINIARRLSNEPICTVASRSVVQFAWRVVRLITPPAPPRPKIIAFGPLSASTRSTHCTDRESTARHRGYRPRRSRQWSWCHGTRRRRGCPRPAPCRTPGTYRITSARFCIDWSAIITHVTTVMAWGTFLSGVYVLVPVSVLVTSWAATASTWIPSLSMRTSSA